MPLTVQAFPTADLSTFHRNPRRGDVARIAESLAARGQYRPIVVNVGTLTGRPNEVLAGNHTLAAAVSLGWESIEATTVDVDDEGAAQIVLADNRLADLGGYDDEALIAVLQAAGDLEGTGYSSNDLAALLAMQEEPVALTGVDDVPDLPEEPVSQVGIVWELGPHRLLVGDATDVPAVAAAAGGPVDCVWTDPPYGVSYVGKTADALTIQNDGAGEAGELAAAAMRTAAAVSRPGAAVYVAHADALRAPFVAGMEAAGIKHRQTLIWVKNVMVLGHADYHWRHEPILYGFTGGGEGRLGRGGDHWFGDNAATTVFEVDVPARVVEYRPEDELATTVFRVDKPKRNGQHPTMKPVDLIVPMIKNSCPPGGLVLDLFGGSGSTLIAAHHARMRSVLVELDPRYADVICRRWQEHTGVVPLLEGKPVTFV